MRLTSINEMRNYHIRVDDLWSNALRLVRK